MLPGQRNLELSAVNIPGADIEVSQIYKNNVLYFLKNYNYYSSYDYYDYYYTPYYDVENYGHSLRSEST